MPVYANSVQFTMKIFYAVEEVEDHVSKSYFKNVDYTSVELSVILENLMTWDI